MAWHKRTPEPPALQCPECTGTGFLVRGGIYEFAMAPTGPTKREVGWYGLCADTACACRVTFDAHGFRRYDPTEVKPKREESPDRQPKRDPWGGLAFSGRS